MKFNKLRLLWGGYLCCIALSVSAENIPLNEENFPDEGFRAWIEYMGARTDVPASNKIVITTDASGNKYADFSSFTNSGTIKPSDNSKPPIKDLTGIRYFTSLTSTDLSYLVSTGGIKYVDLRGLTKLTSLTLGSSIGGFNSTITSPASPSFNKTAFSTHVLETLLLDETAIVRLAVNNLRNLRNVSLKNCSRLSQIIAPYNNIMGLDLTGCTSLTYVNVQYNPSLSFIRFDNAAKGLTQLHACDCDIKEVLLPESIAKMTTINLDGNPNLSYIDLTPLKTSTSAVSQLKFQKCGLASLPLNKYSISNLTFGDQNYHAGAVESFNIHQPDELGTNEQVTILKGGKYDKATGVFTFDEGVYTASYTFQAYTKSYKTAKFNVNVTREPKPLELYIEYSPNNPIRDQYFGTAVQTFADEPTSNYERMPLTYLGDNEYLYEGYLMGNFKIVQVNEDGSEAYLGSNASQVTSMYSDWDDAHVQVKYTTEGSSYALHKSQDVKILDVDSSTKKFTWGTAVPAHDFTTHIDEGADEGRQIPDAKLIVKYINGDPAGKLTLIGGTTTGRDDVMQDKVEEPVDTNAPVEYYDLQGRKVSNPSHGIFIRRQGTAVTKIAL